MSSSTSSSDPRPAGGRRRPLSRGPYVKVLLAIVLGMGASLAIVRVTTILFDASAETILTRVTEARAALPDIAREDKPLVMSFGSSMTQAAFGARQFDREMAERGIEVKSFNFGFGGLNPYFQDYLSRRIRDEFVAADRRLALALIEFTPLQNTRARWEGAREAVDSYVAMLADGGDVWDVAREDPTRGIRLATIKYLRDDISAEMTTWYFGSLIFDVSRPDAGVPADEEKDRILEEVGEKLNRKFEEEYPDYVPSQWNPEWQGAGTIPEERSAETLELFVEYYDAVRSEQRLADDRLWRITCCDIEDLHFEETLLAAFVRTVENFKQFSDRVEVILLPRNHDWIGRPPEAADRLRRALDRIERETGVTVRSFEDVPGFSGENFSDTTHLARYFGDVPYTSLLVETYAPLLKR